MSLLILFWKSFFTLVNSTFEIIFWRSSWNSIKSLCWGGHLGVSKPYLKVLPDSFSKNKVFHLFHRIRLTSSSKISIRIFKWSFFNRTGILLHSKCQPYKKNGQCQPYKKPNNTPTYININSNHPPNIIKVLPNIISKRIRSFHPIKQHLIISHLSVTTYCLWVSTKKSYLSTRFDAFKESETRKDNMV